MELHLLEAMLIVEVLYVERGILIHNDDHPRVKKYIIVHQGYQIMRTSFVPMIQKESMKNI